MICSIDPGLNGALAWLTPDGFLIEVADMPTVQVKVGKKLRARADADALAEMFGRRDVSHCFLEEVGVRPGEGAVGAFAFGRGFGAIEGALAVCRIPTTLVRPQTWKAALNLPADKNAARARAALIWPGAAPQFKRVKDDGRAEAALIGLYGCQRIHGASVAAIGAARPSTTTSEGA